MLKDFLFGRYYAHDTRHGRRHVGRKKRLAAAFYGAGASAPVILRAYDY